MWPYIEGTNLAAQYDYDLSFYAPANKPTVLTQESYYFCPSDRRGLWTCDIFHRSRGNYVVNWGNSDYTHAGWTYRQAPFTNGWHRWIGHSDIRDGLSKTVFMSEVIQAETDGIENAGHDFRGDFINDDAGCSQFMTRHTPNSGVDRIPCTDPNLPAQCLNTTSDVNTAARSRHPAGVQAAMGDGSVRFVTDSVDLSTWQALGTISNGETLSGDW
jgi:hypothetical protein